MGDIQSRCVAATDRAVRRRAVVLAATATVALAAGLFRLPASAQGPTEPPQRDVVIRSFDGTPIVTHFFPAWGVRPGTRTPLVMVAHGWGEKGPTDPHGARLAGAPTVSALLNAGYDVLTWDARGHGGSGGTAMVDSPEFEVRDTEALIDWAARQPEVELDAPGDPRVGMAGASYGGLIQLLTAAFDPRVDVIEPAYTGNSLPYVFAPSGAFKQTWAAFLGGTAAENIPPGLSSPAGLQLHSLDPAAASGLAQGIATGQLSAAFARYLDYRSPGRYLSRVHIPTLLQQGTPDSLFSIVNANQTYATLRARGVPVKMIWNCEGHSVCLTSSGPTGKFDSEGISWFDRWLKRKTSVRTGPAFEWLPDNERAYRSAPVYPPAESGRLHGVGSGVLALSPADSVGGGGFVLIGGRPSEDAVSVSVAAPRAPADVVGAPRLTLTYSGLAAPAQAHLFAQVVDLVSGRVVGPQVTAIRVTLDGGRHTLTVDLNPIATRAGPGSRYEVQIMPGSLVFGVQRSVGEIDLTRVEASLPMVEGHR
jgi:ABC-2 type transport system ATP-binding protein